MLGKEEHAMEKKLNVKPEFDEQVKTEVKGYGCGDDCTEYYPRISGEGCGWNPGPKSCIFW